MNVVLVDMYMILQKEIRITESLPEQHLRISPMTGYAPSAASPRTSSAQWLTDRSTFPIRGTGSKLSTIRKG